MNIKGSTDSKNSVFTFVCAFQGKLRKIIMFSFISDSLYLWWKFVALVVHHCQVNVEDNTPNLNDCISVMMNIRSGKGSDSLVTFLCLSFYFLFSTLSLFLCVPLTLSLLFSFKAEHTHTPLLKNDYQMWTEPFPSPKISHDRRMTGKCAGLVSQTRWGSDGGIN